MSRLIGVSVALIALQMGCSFAARNPATYRDDTQAALEAKNAEIQRCYDGVLAQMPGAQGRVTVNFEVETEHGRVTNVALDPANSTAPPAVAECVLRNIEGVAIHPPDQRTGIATWVYDFTAPPAAPEATEAAG
jgi:cysteine synthase